MEVTGVNNTYQTAAAATSTVAKEQETTNQAVDTNTQKDNNAAVYEKSSEKKANYVIDKKLVNAAIDEAKNQGERLLQLVQKLLSKQGQKYGQAGQAVELNKSFFENLEVDEATRLKAQEDISEDGYYGVKKTSERILDFAKALSGGDPSKIETLRNAVEKGFKAAEKSWGDKLPDISQKTYDAVMKGFDDWAKSAS